MRSLSVQIYKAMASNMDNGNGGGYPVPGESITSLIGLRLEMNRIKESEAISQLAFGLNSSASGLPKVSW
jgi:hypothetical protein